MRGRVRPSRASSVLTAVVGIGMLVFVVSSGFLGSAGGFQLLFLLALGAVIVFSGVNAFSGRGMASEVFEIEERDATRLRTLEELRRDGLITDAEYAEKRAEIMRSQW